MSDFWSYLPVSGTADGGKTRKKGSAVESSSPGGMTRSYREDYISVGASVTCTLLAFVRSRKAVQSNNVSKESTNPSSRLLEDNRKVNEIHGYSTNVSSTVSGKRTGYAVFHRERLIRILRFFLLFSKR